MALTILGLLGAWCGQRNLDELSGVQPFHVAAFIKDLQAEVSPPTVKQHLAALACCSTGPSPGM
jgi:hypothetical protein